MNHRHFSSAQLKQLLFILFINHTIASVWYLLLDWSSVQSTKAKSLRLFFLRWKKPPTPRFRLGQNNGWLYAYEIPTNDWWQPGWRLLWNSWIKLNISLGIPCSHDICETHIFQVRKEVSPLFRGDITWLTKLRYTYLITLHWSLTQFTPASMTAAWQQVPVLHRVNCIESLQDCNFEAFCSEVLFNQNISKHCWACPRCSQPIFTREGLMWRWWFLPWWPSPLLCCSVWSNFIRMSTLADT